MEVGVGDKTRAEKDQTPPAPSTVPQPPPVIVTTGTPTHSILAQRDTTVCLGHSTVPLPLQQVKGEMPNHLGHRMLSGHVAMSLHRAQKRCAELSIES